ncbi:hypothetical protein EC991_002180 [Linnemannia zychae]|nr:hypothetical protein EC991_002180 [Linnemannia zychae]
MTLHGTVPTIQAVRRVYENGLAVIDNGAGIINIQCRKDASSGESIVLWDDIKTVFDNARYVRSGNFAVPFLRGPDFKNLDPPRIAAIPGVTLDVVVTGSAAAASPPTSTLQQIAHQAAQLPRHDLLSALQPRPWTPAPHFTTRNNTHHIVDHYHAPVHPASKRHTYDTATRTHKRVYDLNKVKTVIKKIAVCIDLDMLHTKGDGRPQDFRKALECYLKTIQKGQTQALISVGDLFFDGQDVQQNPTIAMGWYLKAAYLGDNNARHKIEQLRLEFPPLSSSSREPLLEESKGGQQDKDRDKVTTYITAVDRHRKEADQGDSTAQHNVGLLYFAAQEYSQAMAWYRKAAEQGQILAHLYIGRMYHEGLGVSQDHVEAMIWYRKAAEQGDASAKYNIGVMYEQGHGVSRDYDKAMYWYQMAAEQGDISAQYNIGLMYEHGRGALQDYSKAMIWYQKAAAQGDASAQYSIGVMHEQGRGVSQDYAKAMTWFVMAAEQEHIVAQHNIGRMYSQGRGVSQDNVKAMFWYRKAAEQGDASAQYNTGVMYDQGCGVSQDYAKAMAWYRKAAEQGDASAQYAIGVMYRRGRGVPQDHAEAMTWYRKAAEGGHVAAQNKVTVMV